jgi:tetratricopeptide (TPR) repeat protein
MSSSIVLRAALLAGFLGSGLFAQDSGAKQRDLTLESVEKLKTPPVVPRGYAVVIGVSNYKNLSPNQNLLFAEKDAENFYSALISKEAGNMEFENVKKLIGPAATLQNIREALEVWLPSHAQEADRAVVYFVGHGMTDPQGRGYLAPYDLDLKHVSDTGYSMQKLGEVVSKSVKARWKMLIMDACHSGKVSVDTSADRLNESLRGLPQGFLTLASSRASEVSYEDPALAGGNGVFTYFLVKGWLGEADDSPTDGVVTADELISYAEREVRNYTRGSNGKVQSPVDMGDFPDNMILGFSPTKRTSLVAKLPQLSNGTLMVEVNLDNVQIFVDDKQYGVAGKDKAFPIPGLASGSHTVRGVRMGYEPVSVDVNVVPGSTQTVSLHLLYQRTVKPQAKADYDQAVAIWQRSQASPSDLTKASGLLTAALKEQPDFSRAALELCRVQQKQDQTSVALKSCKRAVDLDPDFVEARVQTGGILMESGDYQEAVRQLQQAATQDPHDSMVASTLAEALYLADRPQEAEQAAGKALALDANSGQAYLMRAEARRAQKNFDGAVEDYQKVLKLEEYGSSTLRKVAFFAIGTGMTKHRSGIQFLYRAHKAAAYYGLCAAEIGKADYLRAIKYCQNSLATEHDDPDSYVLLGECYTLLFNSDNRPDYLSDAERSFQSALRINPNMDQAAIVRKKVKEIQELKAVVH